MRHQYPQLSLCKWSHRLLGIWNAPRGGKCEIGPQRFESLVKAVGQILLVRELVISCYMTASLSPRSILCVGDCILGTNARCPMTQPLVLKVPFRVYSMLPLPAGELRVVAFCILLLEELSVDGAPSISLCL